MTARLPADLVRGLSQPVRGEAVEDPSFIRGQLSRGDDDDDDVVRVTKRRYNGIDHWRVFSFTDTTTHAQRPEPR